jgi:foldase protein PrsA
MTPSPTATEQTPEASPTSSDEAQATEDAGTGESEADNTVDAEQSTPTPEVSPTITLTPTPFTTEVFGQNLEDFNDLYKPYGFTVEDLRAIFEVQILAEKLQEEVTADLIPFKDEVWARHILVDTEEDAQEVLAALDSGESFHDLAAEYSVDDSNSQEGGNLGWFDTEMMVPEFTEAAFSLEKGEISDPIKTDFGYHIIQVISKRESQIPASQFQANKQEAFANWLSEQRNSREDIIIYDEWEQHVPTTPEIPQQFLFQLYQQVE